MTADRGRPAAGFAAQLRGTRQAAGLTQAELAAKAGVGVRTVRDLERGRAARPQRTTVELLSAALDLHGESHARFLLAARRPVAAAPIPVRPATLALPAEIPLYGRDRELVAVAGLLGVAAVVTLVGLVGVGKTSLGIAVLHRSGAQYPGGVAGVAISDGAGEADILAAVASVFGVGRASDLADRFRGAPTLLMVDGVERSSSVGGAIRWLCGQASTLRVVATGLRPLELPGERVVSVEPLAVPPADPPATLAELAAYPAAALFLARLAEVRREPVADSQVAALVALVRRLGGLPLALELAAARGRVLDPGELLDRYGDRLLDLDVPSADPSHRLRTAVAGSYRLLEPDARYALRQLSVFRGRWSVGLAEDLLVAVDDPVAVLDRLVGLGLVTARGAGPYRFRVLEAVRELADEEAHSAGESNAARRRHAVVMARLAARTAPELAGSTMAAAVNRLDYVASDLWAALGYATAEDPHTALALAADLARWWRFRGRDVAGRHWLRRLLDDRRTADADPTVRARARLGVAQLAQEHGAGHAELAEAEAALAAFQATADVSGELAARSLLCALWTAGGGYDEARRHAEAALALATRTKRVRDMAVAQNNLTWHETRLGDLAAARRRLAAVDRLAAQCEDVRLRVDARLSLAEVARWDGRYDESIATAQAALAVLVELGDARHRRRALGTVGLALAQAGRAAEAAEVLTDLRAVDADGAPAAIEGHLALHRGNHGLAAEWFAAAASAAASVGRYDTRDLVEALVGLAASTSAPERTGVVDRLIEVCRQRGITLLTRERDLLAAPDAKGLAAPDAND